jgi:O-antigen ligase
MTLLQKYFLLLIGILPIVSPIRVDLGWINVSPEVLKLSVGMVGMLLLLSWWLIKQYFLGKIEAVQTTLYTPLIGFLIWSFITLLWVEDWNLAIIMLYQYLAFVMSFILFLNIFLNFDNGRAVLKVLILSMTIVSIIGLLQYYFYNTSEIQNLFIQTAKPGATFSNKNMASHFIVMVVPLSFALFISAQQKIKIYMYGLAMFIGFWFLIYTTARQAYLAILIEVFIVVIFFTLDFYKNKDISFIRTMSEAKTKTISLVFIFISLIFVSNLSHQGFNFGSGLKTNKLISINLDGGKNRFPAWKNTIEMIKDNPISGVGVGQWQAKYPIYYDKVSKDVIFNESVRLKRLHNEYLEVFANFGIIGYIFLLWISFVIIKSLWRILSDCNHRFRMEILGVSMGLAGFSIVAMFSFPIRVFLPGFLLMIFFALIILASKEQLLERTKIIKSKIILGFIAATSVLLSSYLSLNSYKWTEANRHYLIARALENLGENKLAAGAGLESLSLNPYSPDYYSMVGRNLFKSKKVKESVFFFKKSIDISPFDTGNLINLAFAFNSLKNFSMEKKVLDLIIRIDPKNVRASAQLVRVLIKNDKYSDAEIMYKNLKNNFIYFKDRNNFGPYNDVVGKISMSIGDFNFAEFVYQDALNRRETADNYLKLATVKFYNLNKQREGVKLYKKALAIDSNIPKNREIKVLIEKYESSTER